MKPKLLTFIKEARNRGFDDFQIRQPLMQKGWPLDEIETAFAFLKPKAKYKKQSLFIPGF